jgi:folate-binding protein YgfZ
MSSPADLCLYEAHAAAGARFAERRGRPVVGSYGDAAGEYAALVRGAGLVDLPTRGVLQAAGAVRLGFLQGMLSNDVAGRSPGQGCRAAMLAARGSVQALVRALVEKDAVLLETDLERVLPLRKALEFHRVAAPVRFEPRPAAVVGLAGEDAEEVLGRAGVAMPAEPESHVAGSLGGAPVRVARAGDLPGGGFVVHASPEGARPAWDALVAAGARPVGIEALDVRRVEALRPWWGDDVTEDNLLHETGLVPEIASFHKGCYVGQEVVARLDARGGHVNKALRGLRLDAPAAPGATVAVAGKSVGRVTTAGASPRLGPIALAYVHRDHFAPGTAVEVDGRPATVLAWFEDPGALP